MFWRRVLRFDARRIGLESLFFDTLRSQSRYGYRCEAPEKPTRESHILVTMSEEWCFPNDRQHLTCLWRTVPWPFYRLGGYHQMQSEKRARKRSCLRSQVEPGSRRLANRIATAYLQLQSAAIASNTELVLRRPMYESVWQTLCGTDQLSWRVTTLSMAPMGPRELLSARGQCFYLPRLRKVPIASPQCSCMTELSG